MHIVPYMKAFQLTYLDDRGDAADGPLRGGVNEALLTNICITVSFEAPRAFLK